MPTYDYTCEHCGHEFEAFHGMSTTLTTCPECGQESLRRLIGGGAGLIFKGSGFYQTDYKGESKARPKATPDTPAKADPAPKADSPKPAEKKGD